MAGRRQPIAVAAICLLALTISCTQVVCAATYYVSPTGTSGLSTDRAAPGTLAYAQNHVAAGDTVNLLAGSYGQWTLSAADSKGSSWSAPITYQKDSLTARSAVKLRQVVFNEVGNSYFILDNLTVEVNTVGLSDASYGVYLDTSDHIQLKNCDIYGEVNDLGPRIAIVRLGWNAHGVTDVNITGCLIHNSSGVAGSNDYPDRKSVV
jgi:hypothetical protein